VLEKSKTEKKEKSDTIVTGIIASTSENSQKAAATAACYNEIADNIRGIVQQYKNCNPKTIMDS
jgi:hypothetical protein